MAPELARKWHLQHSRSPSNPGPPESLKSGISTSRNRHHKHFPKSELMAAPLKSHFHIMQAPSVKLPENRIASYVSTIFTWILENLSHSQQKSNNSFHFLNFISYKLANICSKINKQTSLCTEVQRGRSP